MHCSVIKALIAVLPKSHTWPDPIFGQALILHCRGAYTASNNAPAQKEGLAM